jgi:hypothetical protein
MIEDIQKMHEKFHVTEFIDNSINNKSLLKKYLKFRLDFIQEELNETIDAYVNKDDKEVVDGLIDILVVTLGTLDIFKCNTPKAWASIMKSNLSKKPGVNLHRQNNFGLPDLIKDEEFIEPDLKGCTGILKKIL